jgi:predicted transcriptional regulator
MGLVHIFGDKPVPKILDFFRIHQHWDYSIKDVSEATGISYRTLQILMPELVKKRFIKYTRTEGKAKMYMFDNESIIAKDLHEFARKIDIESSKTISERKKPSKLEKSVPASY